MPSQSLSLCVLTTCSSASTTCAWSPAICATTAMTAGTTLMRSAAVRFWNCCSSNLFGIWDEHFTKASSKIDIFQLLEMSLAFFFVNNNKIEQKGFVKRCNFEQGLCSWTESATDTPHAKWMRKRAEEAWPTFGPDRDHTHNSAAGRIVWAATKIIWQSFTWWLLLEPFF